MLEISYEQDHELGNLRTLENIRILAGTAAAAQILPYASQLILESAENRKAMLKILHWKNLQVPFWTPSENPYKPPRKSKRKRVEFGIYTERIRELDVEEEESETKLEVMFETTFKLNKKEAYLKL